MTDPRVWSMPEQPGRDVSKVIDDEDTTWVRVEHPDGDGWRWESDPDMFPVEWTEVLLASPLTEVVITEHILEIDDVDDHHSYWECSCGEGGRTSGDVKVAAEKHVPESDLVRWRNRG